MSSIWDPGELRSLRCFFWHEAARHLLAIRAAFAELRQRAGRSSWASLLRPLHTLKGSAGSVELDEIARAVHQLEDLLLPLAQRERLGSEELTWLAREVAALEALITNQEREGADAAPASTLQTIDLEQLFARFGHWVPELARSEGKEATLVVDGGGMVVASTIADRVAEALLHLVRNALAHGIELPKERLARNKPRAGTVKLSGRQSGDRIEIGVADDGRGIDLVALRQTLCVRSADPSLELDERALLAALFEPGISTRGQADSLAGRGVGLDAVRDGVAQLGGIIHVQTRPGEGSYFAMYLPTSTSPQ